MRSVLLAGGGTAGHVNPLLATAATLRARHPDIRLLTLGTERGLEATLVPQAGEELVFIPRVALPRSISPDWVRLPARMSAAVRAARAAIDRIEASAVVGFGGYVSTPAYLAARKANVPIVIHEANSRPGLANRLGVRFAARVATTFPGTDLEGAVLTGLPLRPAIASLDRTARRAQARVELGLDPNRPCLLVTGGSQGAVRINEAVVPVIGQIVDAGGQILHLTGRGKSATGPLGEAELRGEPHYHALEYLEQMEVAFAAADLTLSRAGASTVCELAAVGMPAIYVPYPHGNGEQKVNCRDVVEAGGGVLVADAQLDSAWVLDHLVPLLCDEAGLARMGHAAASVGIRDGAERLVDLIEEVWSQ